MAKPEYSEAAQDLIIKLSLQGPMTTSRIAREIRAFPYAHLLSACKAMQGRGHVKILKDGRWCLVTGPHLRDYF